VGADLGHDGLVIPGPRADESLKGLEGDAGLVGDRLGGLEIQAGELALEDEGGVGALLGASEQGEVAWQEGVQASGAGVDLLGRAAGRVEQDFCFRMSQDGRHDRLSRLWPTARVAGGTAMGRAYPLQ
jgi:hypothetical protein